MPQISNSVSLGNILTIAAMAVAVITAWSTVNAQVTQHGKELLDHENRLRVIELKIGDNLARIDERLGNIERKLATVPAMGVE